MRPDLSFRIWCLACKFCLTGFPNRLAASGEADNQIPRRVLCFHGMQQHCIEAKAGPDRVPAVRMYMDGDFIIDPHSRMHGRRS